MTSKKMVRMAVVRDLQDLYLHAEKYIPCDENKSSVDTLRVSTSPIPWSDERVLYSFATDPLELIDRLIEIAGKSNKVVELERKAILSFMRDTAGVLRSNSNNHVAANLIGSKIDEDGRTMLMDFLTHAFESLVRKLEKHGFGGDSSDVLSSIVEDMIVDG